MNNFNLPGDIEQDRSANYFAEDGLRLLQGLNKALGENPVVGNSNDKETEPEEFGEAGMFQPKLQDLRQNTEQKPGKYELNHMRCR